MSTVSAHVALTLAQHVDAVFGVMGNGNAWFLDALERGTAVSFTAVRHEQGAVVAADAYHRAGGGIASLYASILVGVNLYALIGPMTAFASPRTPGTIAG